MKKVNKALAKDSKTRANERAKDPNAGNFRADVKPTLPVLDTSPSSYPRSDVVGLEPTVPSVSLDAVRPQPPYRFVTESSFRSNESYESDAPLLGSAGGMGYGGNGHPGRNAPSRMDSEIRTLHSARPPPPNRSFTGNSQSTERSFNSSSSVPGPPNRQNSDISGRTTPASIPSQPQSLKPMPRDVTVGRRPSGSAGFNPPTQEFEMHSTLNRVNKPPNNGGYLAFNPHTQSTSSGAPFSAYSTPSSAAPSRNLTLPSRAPNDYFGSIDRPAQRSGTAPLPPATTFNPSLDDPYTGNWQQSFTRPVGPSRPATATPSFGYGQRRPMPPRY